MGLGVNILQVIKYEGDNKTFIWKHPAEDFSTMSQLIVHESQEAIFFKDGQALDLFGPGRYTLETGNIPIIGKLLSLPTGGETPFHCEVYYINKTEQMAIKWGTDAKVQYTEPTYGFPISIGASGEMSLTVQDSRKLLVKLVGTENSLTQERLVAYFRGILMSKVKPYLARVMVEKKIDIFQADSMLEELSGELKERLVPDFEDYGVTLERFFVTTIQKPDGDESYERYKKLFFEQSIGIKEEELRQRKELIRQETASQKLVMESAALAQKRAQEGYTYQQERSFDVMGDMARNEGSGSDFRNAAMGIGVGFGAGGAFGNAINTLSQNTLGSFGANQPPQAQPQGADPSQAQAGGSGENDIQKRIEKLNLLKGMISEEQYQKKLEEILNAI